MYSAPGGEPPVGPVLTRTNGARRILAEPGNPLQSEDRGGV